MTKFFIDQHGCAKNQVDGEILISHLLKLGLEQTFDSDDADVIIVNSCGFIQSAKTESLDAVCSARAAYPSAKIILAGCLAQRYADTLKDALPEADAIFGNGDLDKIDEIIKPMMSGGRPVLVPEQAGVCCGDRKVMLSFRGSAFVKITEGCSNHCTFCAIPVIRGELRSRRAEEIISEIKKLLSEGIVEINLIGQDLAAYGTGENDSVFGLGRHELPVITGDGRNCGTEKPSALSMLLEQISAVPGNFIVRLLYIHPDHFNRDILPVIKKDSRLLPYFDIPFQTGDDNLIHAMNRRGTAAEYERLVKDIRDFLPDAVLRTTFLTGFPGETDKAAENTREFLKRIEFDWSGCFPYSREEDTPAYSMKKRVGGKAAKARAEELCVIQSEITRSHLAGYVGKEFDVLIEEVIEGGEGFAIGRAWFQAPDVDGSVVVRYDGSDESQKEFVKAGRFVRVRIEAAGDIDLDAILLGDSKLNEGVPQSLLAFAPELQKD